MGYEETIEVREQMRKTVDDLQAELQSLKSRLPVNADGDVVLWGDTLFVMREGFEDEVIVRQIGYDEGGSFELSVVSEYDAEFYDVIEKDCHSSAESCRAAQEGGAE